MEKAYTNVNVSNSSVVYIVFKTQCLTLFLKKVF